MKKSRVISVLLTLVFLVSAISASSVSAATPDAASGQTKTITISGKKIEVDSTVSAKELSYLTPDIMSDYDPEGVVVSVSQTITPMSGDVPTPTTRSTIQLSTISASKMTVTAVCERIVDKGSSYDEFKFSSWATWASKPYITMTDKLALSWSGGFSLYSSTCIIWKSGPVSPGSSYGVRSDVVPSAGVAYDIPLEPIGVGDIGYNYKTKIIAYVYNTNATGTANLVAKYAHATVLPGISVSLSGAPTISFSGTYDESVPAYCAWTY